MNNTAIIILAAGESARLTEPKQLLIYKNKSLIANIVDEALLVNDADVFVVTGAFADVVGAQVNEERATIIFNEQWKAGIGKSIAVGVKSVVDQRPDVKQIILAVCDQPFVNAELLENLISTKLTVEKNIVAASYVGTTGTPALFAEPYFAELMTLDGSKGAKAILHDYAYDVELVTFSLGAIDIDTMDDYLNLNSGLESNDDVF